MNEAAGEAGDQFSLCTKARRIDPLDLRDEVEVTIHGDDLFDPVIDHGASWAASLRGTVNLFL